MELLESQNSERTRLMETSDLHRRELEKEVKAIREKTEQILTRALIIGGSLALTYFVIRQIRSSGKKKEKALGNTAGGDTAREEAGPSEPSLISQIGKKVIDQATLILLDMAKEKLVEYLESRKQHNENS